METEAIQNFKKNIISIGRLLWEKSAVLLEPHLRRPEAPGSPDAPIA